MRSTHSKRRAPSRRFSRRHALGSLYGHRISRGRLFCVRLVLARRMAVLGCVAAGQLPPEALQSCDLSNLRAGRILRCGGFMHPCRKEGRLLAVKLLRQWAARGARRGCRLSSAGLLVGSRYAKIECWCESLSGVFSVFTCSEFARFRCGGRCWYWWARCASIWYIFRYKYGAITKVCAHVKNVKNVPSSIMSVSHCHSFFCVGRTRWVVLSAAATQNRVKTLMMVQLLRP